LLTLQGKRVYETLAELVHPQHTAVLVIDMQNESCSEGGLYAGLDLSLYETAIPRIHELLDAARRHGTLVLHTRTVVMREDLSPAHLRRLWILHRRKYGNATPRLAEVDFSPPDSFDADFVDDLRPADGDIVIRKLRPSAFAGTHLDLVLRSNGIETLLITGVVTEGCVDSTAREAHSLNYYAVIVADAVASDDRELHDATLKTMQVYYETPSVKEVLAAWASL
jgi:nicotinamidase-related amidase